MNKESITIVLKGLPDEYTKSVFEFVSDILDYSSDRQFTITQSYDKNDTYKIKVRLK
jgi:hypothetical protein